MLIFDEATSALDVTSEQIVQAALDRVAQSRTTIIIAHRLATISDADSIIVMKKGKVIQQGTHSELVKIKEGAYWSLVRSQQLATISKNSVHHIQDDDKLEPITKRQSVIAEKESHETLVESEATAAESIRSATSLPSPTFGLWSSLRLLIVEQERNWCGYFFMVVAAMGAAGE